MLPEPPWWCRRPANHFCAGALSLAFAGFYIAVPRRRLSGFGLGPRWVWNRAQASPVATRIGQLEAAGPDVQAIVRLQRIEQLHAQAPGQVPVATAGIALALAFGMRPGLVVDIALGHQRQRLQGMRHLRIGEPEIAIPPARLADEKRASTSLARCPLAVAGVTDAAFASSPALANSPASR